MPPSDLQTDLSVRTAGLTGQERIVLTMVAEGKRPLEIGASLSMSEPDVEKVLEGAEHKLGATNRFHAVSLILLHGIETEHHFE